MKISFMSFSTPQLTLTETLDLAEELGYDGFEPRAGSGHAHGIELETSSSQRNAIKAQVAESPIELCCLAVSCRYADPSTVAENVQETMRYIDLAADLDIPRLRVFGGQIPEQVNREAAIENVAAALRQLAAHVQERQVTVCLETHDDWCDPNHVVAIMQQVDSPAVAVNWDIMHPVRACGFTMEEAFTILQPWVQHVHIHDGLRTLDELKMLPIGQGDIDHEEALALLQKDGYTGYLSGEWINWEPHLIHLPRELAAVHAILGE